MGALPSALRTPGRLIKLNVFFTFYFYKIILDILLSKSPLDSDEIAILPASNDSRSGGIAAS